MGEFHLKHYEHGKLIDRAVFNNSLHREGMQYFYRSIFPPTEGSTGFQMGIAGPDAVDRPNHATTVTPYGFELTFDNCTDVNANEGGAYSDPMRDMIGYERQGVEFTTELIGAGGQVTSNKVTFKNNQKWVRHGNWQTQHGENPPGGRWQYKLGQCSQYAHLDTDEDHLGYPWCVPIVKCTVSENGRSPAYPDQWEPGGLLRWLCDFRKLGAFPITLLFIFSTTTNKLVATAHFARPLMLRPFGILEVIYVGRIRSMAHTPNTNLLP